MNLDKKTLIPVAVLIVVIALGTWLFLRNREPQIVIFNSNDAVKALEASDRSVGINEYMKRNLSGFSAEAGYPGEVGGTFQVTSIEAKNGTGSVSYEDGHNSYTADFKYTTDKKGLVTVTSFTVRKK